MPLALDAITFEVETKKLLDAKQAIQDLSTAMQGLNKAQQDESKAAISAAKVKEAEAKATIAAAKAKEAEVKATDTNTEANKKNTSVLERQQSILEYMTQGFSKGQSSVLAYAKASGALGDELKQLESVLQTQRKLMGSDPFDKSMSGVIALQNQLGELREAFRQYNSGVELTRNQTRELARDKERIIERLRQEGASFSDIKNAIKAYNQEFIAAAGAVNSFIGREKELERTQRERVNAIRNLANAEEKAASMVATYTGAVQTGDSVTERAAASIANYERWLRQAGISGDQATAKLKAFSAQQAIIAQQEQKQREAYLTRAIIPQFSDIFVGLTTGQNPLTIALQQLPQIQDLFTLTGVKAQDTVKVMGQAASEMLVRLQSTALAVTQAIGLGFANLGNSIVKGLTEPLKLAYVAVESLFVKRNLDASLGPQISNLELAARNASVAFAGLSKILGGTLLAVLGVVAIEMYKAAKANDALLISVSTAGAALGKSADELARLASVSTAYSTNASELKAFFAELAKEGFKASESLATVAEAAQRYSHVTGASLSDLAKEYAKLNKDPVQALIDLGKATGQIDLATLQMIQSMLDAGDVAGATSRAIAEYAAAQNRTAKEIEENLSPLGKLYLDLKKDASEAWASVSEFANSDKVVRGIKAILEGFKSFGQQLAEINLQFVALRKLRDYLSSPDQGPVGSSALSGLAGVASSVKDSVKTSSSEISGIFETVRKEQERSATESEKYVKRVQGYMSMLSKLDMTNPEHIVLRDQINQLIARESKELEENLSKKKKKTEVEKEAEKVTKAYAAVLERFSDLQVQINRANADGEKSIWETTKAYGLLQDVMNDPSWVKFNEARKTQILQAYANAAAIEVENLLLKEQAKAIKDLQKVQSDFEKNDISRVAEIKKVSKEIEFQYSILGKTDDEVKKLTREYKLQAKEAEVIAKYAKLRFEQEAAYNKAISSVTSSDERLKAEEEYLGRVNTLSLEQEQELANAKKQMNLEVTQDYVKQFLEIRDTIAEATYDALTGKGQDAAKKLRAFIEAQLKKQFIMPAINVMINAGMNMAISGLTSMSGGTSSGSTPTQQATDVFSSASSLYSNAIGGSLATNAYGAFATSSIGQGLGLSSAANFVGPSASLATGATGAAVGEAALTSAGSTIAQAIPYVGWVVAIASLLGAFDDSDIPQSGGNMAWYLGGESFDINQVRNRKLSGGMPKEITNIYEELSQGLADMLKAVGENAADTTAYFYTMINNEGKSGKLAARLFAGNPYEQAKAEQQMLYEYTSSLDSGASDFQEKLAEAYKGMAQAAIKASSLADNTKDLAVYLLETGTSVQELTANWDSIIQWMNSLSNLNKMAPEVAANLTKLGGGLSSFQSLTNSYYSMFFSAAEQTNILIKQLEANFSDIGLVAPTTNEGFRSIVESLDLTTEAGQETFVKLLSLSSAFNQVTSAIDSFYAAQKDIIDSYSSEQQLMLSALTNVRDAFNELGIAMPVTTSEFKALAASADPLTESGRKLIGVLSGVKESFDYLQITLLSTSIAGADSAFTDLQKAVAASKESINANYEAQLAALQSSVDTSSDAISNANALLSTIKQILDVISKAVNTLRGIAEPVVQMQNAREFIDSAITAARSGTVPDLEKLNNAISVVTSDKTSGYVSLVDYKKAQLIQANKLEELGKLTSQQYTTEELTLQTLNASKSLAEQQISELKKNRDNQIAALDALLKKYQEQIDALKGDSPLSVVEAVNNVEVAIANLGETLKFFSTSLIDALEAGKIGSQDFINEIVAKLGITKDVLTQVDTSTGTKDVMAGSGGAAIVEDKIYTPVGWAGSIEEARKIVGRAFSTMAPKDFYNAAKSVGLSGAMIEQMWGMAPGTARAWAEGNGLPAFANGGSYGGGLALVGETGPELINFNSPGQVYTASQTSKILNSSDPEIQREVVEELRMLRVEARATAIHVAKLTKIVDNARGPDDSLNVTVVATV